jgi:Coenzyme PQQ synthesis protein D (PqqD)
MQSTLLKVNAPHVSAESFDGEVMIVNLETGNYYSLTGVAAAAWQLIEKGCTQEALLDAMGLVYRGDSLAMREALDTFFDELLNEELVVEQAGEPAAITVPSALAERPEFVAPILEKYTDMQQLLLIDPIHEVNDAHGWPKMKP